MTNTERDYFITHVLASIDNCIVKGYSLKKAKLFVKIKCECKFKNINKQLMQSIMQLTEAKYLFNHSHENLQVSMFKHRDNVTMIRNKEFDSETQSQE